MARSTIPPFKVCACGCQYSQDAWLKLKPLGVTPVGDAILDWRNCACGSTMIVEVSVDGALAAHLGPELLS